MQLSLISLVLTSAPLAAYALAPVDGVNTGSAIDNVAPLGDVVENIPVGAIESTLGSLTGDIPMVNNIVAQGLKAGIPAAQAAKVPDLTRRQDLPIGQVLNNLDLDSVKGAATGVTSKLSSADQVTGGLFRRDVDTGDLFDVDADDLLDEVPIKASDAIQGAASDLLRTVDVPTLQERGVSRHARMIAKRRNDAAKEVDHAEATLASNLHSLAATFTSQNEELKNAQSSGNVEQITKILKQVQVTATQSMSQIQSIKTEKKAVNYQQLPPQPEAITKITECLKGLDQADIKNVLGNEQLLKTLQSTQGAEDILEPLQKLNVGDASRALDAFKALKSPQHLFSGLSAVDPTKLAQTGGSLDAIKQLQGSQQLVKYAQVDSKTFDFLSAFKNADGAAAFLQAISAAPAKAFEVLTSVSKVTAMPQFLTSLKKVTDVPTLLTAVNSSGDIKAGQIVNYVVVGSSSALVGTENTVGSALIELQGSFQALSRTVATTMDLPGVEVPHVLAVVGGLSGTLGRLGEVVTETVATMSPSSRTQASGFFSLVTNMVGNLDNFVPTA